MLNCPGNKMVSCIFLCYNNRGHDRGADIAFDRWILTDYFAGRFTDVISILIATNLQKAVAFVKGAFAPRALAMQAA